MGDFFFGFLGERFVFVGKSVVDNSLTNCLRVFFFFLWLSCNVLAIFFLSRFFNIYKLIFFNCLVLKKLNFIFFYFYAFGPIVFLSIFFNIYKFYFFIFLKQLKMLKNTRIRQKYILKRKKQSQRCQGLITTIL